jgi:fibronectin type 3 domain-containing protein
VTAVDMVGRESALTAPVTAHLVDKTPPAIPTALAVRNGAGVVEVTWRMSPELDAAGYYIERSTGLHVPYIRLDRALIPVRRPIWTDTIAGGRPYFYRVIAVDSGSNASAPSNPVSALPRDDTPPSPPTGLALATAQHRIAAHWTPVSAKDLRGYYVYQVEGKDRTRITGRPLIAPQFVDSGPVGRGLTPGHAYTIRVTALDSNFNESPPVEGRILVPDDVPPTPPSALSAQNIEGRFVALAWSASGSSDVRAYVLTRTGGPADTGARATHRFPASARAWRDTVVVHGRRYTYRLTAVDSAGNVSAALTDSVAFRELVSPPPPRATAARLVTPGGVEVRWERVVSLELVGYHVYRSSLPTGVYRRLTRAPVSRLTFTDSTGHAGFYYQVRAVDKSGNESTQSPTAPVVTR